MALGSQNVFVGFSTIGNDLTENFTYYDIELVNRDLMNVFMTRIGERVMRPEFGCRIWDYMMEPFTEYNKSLIEAEVKRVCESDTRCVLNSMQTTSTENAIQVSMILTYLPQNVVGNFYVNFENTQTATLGVQ